MSDSNSDNPSNSRILIDEDWKTQVQAEKEKLSQNFADTKESSKTQPASLPPATRSSAAAWGRRLNMTRLAL